MSTTSNNVTPIKMLPNLEDLVKVYKDNNLKPITGQVSSGLPEVRCCCFLGALCIYENIDYIKTDILNGNYVFTSIAVQELRMRGYDIVTLRRTIEDFDMKFSTTYGGNLFWRAQDATA